MLIVEERKHQKGIAAVMPNAARRELGELSDADALHSLIDVHGLNLADIGCGAGASSRRLLELGATVTGIEPDPIQAAKNRAAPPEAKLTFVEGRAEQLPFADDSLDGVVFFRSLHHVPIEHMDEALTEAARVVRRDRGFVCVIEPGMNGDHFQVMRPFHDETVVRTAAQAALARTAPRIFGQVDKCSFVLYPRYADFEAMIVRLTGQTFNSISREMVETSEVRELFEAGRSDDGDYRFVQPMLIDLYRGKL